MTPYVKICGITNGDDALIAAGAGADAVGFVFAPSVRSIEPYEARKIVVGLPPFVIAVGVFKDENIESVNCIADYVGLGVVQLHGSESPAFCAGVKRRVIKRIRVEPYDTKETILQKMAPYTSPLCLLDPGEGSGCTFNWKIAQGITKPLMVAGGLTAENVGEVVQVLKPLAVDVSSGVEGISGRKDPGKVEMFIRRAKGCS